MKFTEQLAIVAKELQKIDWNLYDIRLTQLKLALAGNNQATRRTVRILRRRLDRLYRERAKTVWIKK